MRIITATEAGRNFFVEGVCSRISYPQIVNLTFDTRQDRCLQAFRARFKSYRLRHAQDLYSRTICAAWLDRSTTLIAEELRAMDCQDEYTEPGFRAESRGLPILESVIGRGGHRWVNLPLRATDPSACALRTFSQADLVGQRGKLRSIGNRPRACSATEQRGCQPRAGCHPAPRTVYEFRENAPDRCESAAIAAPVQTRRDAAIAACPDKLVYDAAVLPPRREIRYPGRNTKCEKTGLPFR